MRTAASVHMLPTDLLLRLHPPSGVVQTDEQGTRTERQGLHDAQTAAEPGDVGFRV